MGSKTLDRLLVAGGLVVAAVPPGQIATSLPTT